MRKTKHRELCLDVFYYCTLEVILVTSLQNFTDYFLTIRISSKSKICTETSGEKLKWLFSDKGNILRTAVANMEGHWGKLGRQPIIILIIVGGKNPMQSGWQGNTRSVSKENCMVPGLAIFSGLCDYPFKYRVWHLHTIDWYHMFHSTFRNCFIFIMPL